MGTDGGGNNEDVESDTDHRRDNDVVFCTAVLGGCELRAGRRREHDVYGIGGSRA